MFNGIVQQIGKVTECRITGGCHQLAIKPEIPISDLCIGESIAVNGVCLTVTAFTNDCFQVSIVPETLRRSNLGSLVAGGMVNLERALDLARLAGFAPAAVLCEIMNPDGTMARGKRLEKFAARHTLNMVSISDITDYRLRHENLIEAEASALLPIDKYGSFRIKVIRERYSGDEHIVLFKETTSGKVPLVRIHSSCMTGDLFSSRRCDCQRQLHYALERIGMEGGMLIYLSQEGRGIGLLNKIRAYALQEKGFDTAEANIELGFPVDGRKYHIAANILRHYHISHIRLMTANPDKILDLQKYGISHVDVEAMPSFQDEQNQTYLKTKHEKIHPHRSRMTCLKALP